MQIQVTWEDITSARAELSSDKFKNNSCHCPIARALKRQLSPDIWVYELFFEAVINNETKRFDLPDVARTFIELFDSGRNVKPISFHITI